MSGPSRQEPGVIYRAIRDLFMGMSEREEWRYSVYVSVVEIYNEKVRDLLSKEAKELEVH